MAKKKSFWDKTKSFVKRYVLTGAMLLPSMSFTSAGDADKAKESNNDPHSGETKTILKEQHAFSNQDMKDFIVEQTMLKFGEVLEEEHQYVKGVGSRAAPSFNVKSKKYAEKAGNNYCQGAVSYSFDRAVDEINAKYLKDYLGSINKISCQKFIASAQAYAPDAIISGKVTPHKKGPAEAHVQNTRVPLQEVKAGDNLVYHDSNKVRQARNAGKSHTGDHTYAITTVFKDEADKNVGALLYSYNLDRIMIWGEVTDNYESIIPDDILKKHLKDAKKLDFGETVLGRLAHLKDIAEISLEKELQKDIKAKGIEENTYASIERDILHSYLEDMGISREEAQVLLASYAKGERTAIMRPEAFAQNSNIEKSQELKGKLEQKKIQNISAKTVAVKTDVNYASHHPTSSRSSDRFEELSKRAALHKAVKDRRR